MRQKLEALSSEMHRRQMKELRQRHQDEKFALKEGFEEQFENMKQFWRQKFEVYEAQSKEILEELNSRQAEAREKYEKEIRATLFVHPRMTPEMLNTQYQIQTLVKTQRYDEADRLQKKSSILKGEILSKVGSLAQFKINNLLGRFDKKQKVEKDAIMKKIQSGKLDIEKKRDSEIRVQVNKIKALMENQSEMQRAEIIEMEKNFQSFKPSTNLLSKFLKQAKYQEEDMKANEIEGGEDIERLEKKAMEDSPEDGWQGHGGERLKMTEKEQGSEVNSERDEDY